MPIALNIVVQILLGLSAVIVALRNIYSFFKQPKILVNKYIQDEKKKILEEASKIVVDTIKEIEIVICSNHKELLLKLTADRKALRVILHREIERIYEEGLPTKTLTATQRRHLHTLMERYGEVEGNGYTAGLMNEMSTWTTTVE